MRNYISLILCVLSVQFSGFYAQAELYSKNQNDPHFIKVTTVQNKYLLQVCLKSNRDHCQQLGIRTYTNDELNQVKRQLITAGGVRALAGAVVVAGATVAAGYLGGAAAMAVSGKEMAALINVMVGQILGYGAGFAGGVVTVGMTMNPLNQFRAAEVVGISNIEGEKVLVNARMNYIASIIDNRLTKLGGAEDIVEKEVQIIGLP